MAKKKLPIDPLGSPQYGLRGRIVTMNDSADVINNGIVFVKDSKIAAILLDNAPIPNEFSQFPIIKTNGTIFPGLIELHNHLSYNCLPMWNVPQTYGNRSQWSGIPAYRKLISGPMNILGKTATYPEAIVRYVEAKCLLGGVTTSQGIALFSNNGIQKYYRGIVRNVESTDDATLPAVHGKIADVAATDVQAFFNQLKSSSCLLLHLSEGKDEAAHKHFEALQMPNHEWAITPALAGIHAVALTSADYQIMATHGASIVWSPLSNLLLYGQTANVKAAKDANVTIGIGSDWSPSGSKNLLGELKIAKLYSDNNGHIFSDFEIVSMATKNAAKIIKWNNELGTIEIGKRADLLVVKGSSGDAYNQLFKTNEADINLVVINGIPRSGTKALMQIFALGTEEYDINGSAKILNFNQNTADVVVGHLTLQEATNHLKDGLLNIKTLANNMTSPIGAIHSPAIMGATDNEIIEPTSWFLVLDHNEEEGDDQRHHLPMDGQNTMELIASVAATPIKDIVEPIDLDPLTVVQDAIFFTNLDGQINLPDYIKHNIRAMY